VELVPPEAHDPPAAHRAEGEERAAAEARENTRSGRVKACAAGRQGRQGRRNGRWHWCGCGEWCTFIEGSRHHHQALARHRSLLQPHLHLPHHHPHAPRRRLLLRDEAGGGLRVACVGVTVRAVEGGVAGIVGVGAEASLLRRNFEQVVLLLLP